jgi:HD superfamily phosphohydrolase
LGYWQKKDYLVLQSISPIRDIVHDYVAPSIFEAEVVDSGYFQRLHFVWQNSAAFTVYPCNKNSRFVHSLGVSHLCGRILIHSLRNSDVSVFRDFLVAADKFIDSFVSNSRNKTLSRKLDESWKKSAGNRSRFRHNDLSIAQIKEMFASKTDETRPQITNDPEFTINTLWIALKLAALCHDIGHLPMSHEFETAIKDLPDTGSLFYTSSQSELIAFETKLKNLSPTSWKYCFSSDGAIKPEDSLEIFARLLSVSADDLKIYLEGMKLHERRSIRILDEIMTQPGDSITKEFPEYRTLLFTIATAILLYDSGKLDPPQLVENSQGPIKPNPNNFLRALKDILASQLDADRLDYVARDPKVSGLETGVFDLTRIVSSFVLSKYNGHYVAVPSIRAQTAVEAFFHQRYLNYKSLIYHKSALRSKAVLRQAVMRLIAFSVLVPQHEIAGLCMNVGIIKADEKTGSITEVLPFTEANLEQFDDARLRSLFFDVLNTLRKEGSKKNLNDQQIKVLGSVELLVETFLFRRKMNLISLDYGYQKFSEKLQHFPKSQIAECFKLISAEVQLKHSLSVVPLISKRDPKVYDPTEEDSAQLMMVDKNGKLVPIEEVSPYLKFQRQMVKEEARFIIGFCAKDLRNDPQLQSELFEIATRHLDVTLQNLVNGQEIKIDEFNGVAKSSAGNMKRGE